MGASATPTSRSTASRPSSSCAAPRSGSGAEGCGLGARGGLGAGRLRGSLPWGGTLLGLFLPSLLTRSLSQVMNSLHSHGSCVPGRTSVTGAPKRGNVFTLLLLQKRSGSDQLATMLRKVMSWKCSLQEVCVSHVVTSLLRYCWHKADFCSLARSLSLFHPPPPPHPRNL